MEIYRLLAITRRVAFAFLLENMESHAATDDRTFFVGEVRSK